MTVWICIFNQQKIIFLSIRIFYMVNLMYSGTLLSNTKAELNSSLTSSAKRVNFVGLPGAALPAQAHTPSNSPCEAERSALHLWLVQLFRACWEIWEYSLLNKAPKSLTGDHTEFPSSFLWLNASENFHYRNSTL